jgi:AcrR family transcriptional regulator
MAIEPGLRERKKRRTRQALVEAAGRLFAEQGYESTTVAQLAAAVEIAPRTFFSYFASKEDVLFADADERIRIALDAIADRRPADRPPELLLRAIERVVASRAVTDGLAGEIGTARLALLSSTPPLQAGALRRLLRAQLDISEALRRAYPEELDEVTAAAMVGALVGAVFSAALVGLRRGDGAEALQGELRRAAELAMRGIAGPLPPAARVRTAAQRTSSIGLRSADRPA